MGRAARIAVLCGLGAIPLSAELEFDQTVIELTSPPGAPAVQTTYRFRNAGESKITIIRTETSCDCTRPTLAKTVFGPGERGEIALEFRIGDREGVQDKMLLVHTDEEGRPPYRLALRVDIPVVATITPRLLLWRGGSGTKSVIVENQAAPPLRLIHTEYPSDRFAVDHVELRPGRTFRVNVTPVRADSEARGELKIVVATPNGQEVTYVAHLRCLVSLPRVP